MTAASWVETKNLFSANIADRSMIMRTEIISISISCQGACREASYWFTHLFVPWELLLCVVRNIKSEIESMHF